MKRMRGRGAFLAIAAALLAALPARADKAASRHEVELGAELSRITLLTDGRGHYVALVPFGPTELTFYGDRKQLHQLRVFSSGKDPGRGTESRRFWAPVSSGRGADLEHAEGKWTVRCSDRFTPLVPVSEADSRTILARVTFKKPLWKREAAAFGRDDTGVYYYVDRLRVDRFNPNDPTPPTGFRLFVGRKGKLKQQKLTDSVVDSRGVVLSTRAGHLTVDYKDARMVWSTRRGTTALSYLPVEDNALLIYRDLGLYGRLGIPCDDM